MTVNKKPTGRAKTMAAGLAMGGCISLGITLLEIWILAMLISKDAVAQENTGYGIMMVLLTASWIGSLTAITLIKRQKLLVAALSGLAYFCVLLAITALFFGGQYSGAGETGLLIFCGSMLGFLMRYPEKTLKRKSRI